MFTTLAQMTRGLNGAGANPETATGRRPVPAAALGAHLCNRCYEKGAAARNIVDRLAGQTLLRSG
jgi:hypothetical protein